MVDLVKLSRKITNLFRISGINLLGDDCIYLAEKLSELNEREQNEWLNKIIDNLQNQQLRRNQVSREAIEIAINDLQNIGLDDREPVFSVINSFDVPRFSYNQNKKTFNCDDNVKRKIVTDVAMKSMHLRQRYLMLLQKTLRHELFSPKIIENGVSAESCARKSKLTYVENLLSASHIKEAIVLGYLTQLKKDKYYLTDLTGYVELNLSNTRFHVGFFCEGSFVLAEGDYKEKVLHVSGIGFPPAELAKSSYAFLGHHNTWGGKGSKLLKNSKRLTELEYRNNEASLVFLSDVRLDAPQVKEKLRQLFIGYDIYPPVAIVLMGPFAPSSSNIYEMRQRLRELGELAEGCNELKQHTDLVLVPANDDPTAPNILPRAPLPKALAVDLMKLWPRTILASNPCRLQYCTQQIMVCRLDLMAKFCRNTLNFPTDDVENIERHLARTIICQGHLTPLNALVAPVHWDFDIAMWLFPLPDLVILGDSCRSYQITQDECLIANPGSFSKSKFIFKVYLPAARKLEDSEIPDDMDSAD